MNEEYIYWTKVHNKVAKLVGSTTRYQKTILTYSQGHPNSWPGAVTLFLLVQWFIVYA